MVLYRPTTQKVFSFFLNLCKSKKSGAFEMVAKNCSSDSESSSDDDNLALLREAADTELINDSMFRLAGKGADVKDTDSKQPSTTTTALKSQRHVTDDNKHIDDLLIPEEIQKFVSKKLAKIIENRVEFVDVRSGDEDTNSRTDNLVEPIKLLGDVVLNINWADNSESSTERGRRKKPEIKKRKLPDVDDTKNNRERLKEAVIDLEDVSKEVNNWKATSKGTVFEYQDKNGRLFEVEQTTEFSEKRKRNNWDESKISRNKNRWK